MNDMSRSRLVLAAYGVAALFAVRLPSFYFLPQSSDSLIVRELSALDLGVYSLIAPFVSFVALLPAIVLLPAWFVLVACSIGSGAEERQEVADRAASMRSARIAEANGWR